MNRPPLTSAARAVRDGRRPGRGRRTGALCVLSRRFRTPCRYGLAKVFWSVRCPTQVAPEYEGGAFDVRPYAEPSGVALRQPGHRCGDRRRQVGHGAETGQDVVGSYGRRHVPNNQPQYRTGLVGRPISRRTVRFQLNDGGAGVEGAHTVLGHALHLDGVGLGEGLDRTLRVEGVDAFQPQLPDGSREPVGEARGPRLDRVDDVQPGGQGLVEQTAQGLGVARCGQGDLQVLRLTARAGGCGIGVRHLRVWREPRRVRHGHLGTAQRTLEGALEVTVAGEPEAAALGVAQSDALHRGCGRRAFGLSLAQCPSPS